MLLNRIVLPIVIFIGLVNAIGLGACDAPKCENTNITLQQVPMNSKPYNLEIARMINTADSNTVRYYFSDYREIEGVEYVLVEVHTPNGCALGRFTVANQTGLENLIENVGKGYRGAELLGFKFTIDGDLDLMPLVCLGVEGIRD